jgi:hypothetical protein
MNDTADMVLEAEQHVIGSLLQKPELLSAIDLDPGHFASSSRYAGAPSMPPLGPFSRWRMA